MNFYYNHQLVSRLEGVPSECPMTPIPLDLLEHKEINSYKFFSNIIISNDNKRAVIEFQAVRKKTDTRKQNNFCLGKVILNTTENNCSAIHISQLIACYTNKKSGSHIIKEIKKWALAAGYTLLYGNTANYQNDWLFYFWEKHDFKQMMPVNYVNPRSGSLNIWLYCLLGPPTTRPLTRSPAEIKAEKERVVQAAAAKTEPPRKVKRTIKSKSIYGECV